MKKSGFTLIELLVVIAIIALLMGILMPSLNSAKEQARKVKCGANLKQIGVGLVLYSEEEDGKLPENRDPEHPYTAFRGDGDWAKAPYGSTPMKLGLLYSSEIIKNPEIFYCPSAKIDWLKFKNYIEPSPWGTLPQVYNAEMTLNQWVRTGYSYYPQSRKLDENGFPKVASKYIDLNPNRTAVTDAIWQKSKLSHVSGSRPTGLNALFGDGHVYFTVTEAAFTDELWGTSDLEVRPGTKEFQTILNLLRP